MSIRYASVYNNFARGKIDHDMLGRFDLPVYNTGSDVLENFITNFKGNAIYRSGMEYVADFSNCVLVEFAFSQEQSYLCLFYENAIKFLSYDENGILGFVQSGGSDLTITTTYSLSDCAELQFAQSADTIYITHKDYIPRKLTRVSATSFTLSTFTRTDADFESAVVSDTSTTSNTIGKGEKTFTVSSGKGYVVDEPILLYNSSNQIYGKVKSYSGTTLVVTITDYTGSGTITSWTIKTMLGYPAVCCFHKTRLYYAAPAKKITTIWGSKVGEYDIFTIPPTVDDDDAIKITIASITERIEWLYSGTNSLIVGNRKNIIVVNGGTVNDAITADTVDASTTAAFGSNGVIPLNKDGLVFYVGLNSRNLFFFSYDVLSESFKAEDANFISYDITNSGIKKIRYKKDRNDLIYVLRNDGVLLMLNFNTKENIIGWSKHKTSGTVIDIAVISDNDGDMQLFALVLRNGTYYIERVADDIEFANRIDFFTGDSDADDEAFNRYIAEQLKDCNYLDNSTIISGLKTDNILFNGVDTITITSGSPSYSFTSNDVGKHIVYKSITGYESGRFLITDYVSATEVTVSILQSPTTNTWNNDWFLTFSEITGTTRFNGQTVSIVADGGYLDDFDVSDGTVDLGKQVCVACIGYSYKAILKSFALGFSAQTENTQKTLKKVYAITVRTSMSAGGEVGTSLYNLAEVQELKPNALNYLPPVPTDGTTKISVSGTQDVDMCVYIIQDYPLPFSLCCVIVDAEYGVT